MGEAFTGSDLRVQPAVQLQTEISVFRTILGSFGDLDLIEANLVGAFAAQIFKGNGFESEMAQRELTEVVPAHAGFSGFEYIGLQQRVVRDAGQGDAMIGENVLVVLQVLPDLGVVRAFQPGGKARQYLLAGQLHGRAGIIVGQRNIGRLTRCDGEGNADQTRGKRIEAGGFGVESDEWRALDFLEPDLESCPVGDRGVVACRRLEERCGRRRR